MMCHLPKISKLANITGYQTTCNVRYVWEIYVYMAPTTTWMERYYLSSKLTCTFHMVFIVLEQKINHPHVEGL